jgi:hypothetical protein
MKKQSTTLFTKFSKESLADLTKEVREALASGFNLSNPRSFTAADLWNIQRHSKNMTQRRFIF